MRTSPSFSLVALTASWALALGCTAASPPDPGVTAGRTDTPPVATDAPSSSATPPAATAPSTTLPVGAATNPLDRGDIFLTSRADAEKLRGRAVIRERIHVEHLRGAALPVEQQLRDLTALQDLRDVGGLIVADTDTMVSLDGLEKLEIVREDVDVRENVALTSVDGLANLTRVGGALAIGSLQTVKAVKQADGTTIPVGLPATSNAVLDHVTLNALTSAGSVSVVRNESVTRVELNALREITGVDRPGGTYGLAIGFLPKVTTFVAPRLRNVNGSVQVGVARRTVNTPTKTGVELPTPLNALTRASFPLLTSCDRLSVSSNPRLDTLETPVLDFAGYLRIERNESLHTLRFPKLRATGGLALSQLTLSGTLDFSSLQRVSATFEISDTKELTNLTAFDRVQRMPADVLILSNLDLATLGLYQAHVVNSFVVASNPRLTDVSGLQGLTDVRDRLEISSNPLVKSVALPNLGAAGELSVYGNDTLATLEADALRQVFGVFEIGPQPALTRASFHALKQIGSAPDAAGNATGPAAPMTLTNAGAATLDFTALTHVHGTLTLAPAPPFDVFAALRRVGGDLTVVGPVDGARLTAFVKQLNDREGLKGAVSNPASQ